MAFYDLSTNGVADSEKVARIVRPFCNIGPAIGGDEIKLDASELNHPAMVDSVLTAEEMRENERRADEVRRARMQPADQTARVINEQMKAAAEDRKKRKAKERVEDAVKAKDLVDALRGATAG